jgi:uncharacterized protein YkwD
MPTELLTTKTSMTTEVEENNDGACAFIWTTTTVETYADGSTCTTTKVYRTNGAPRVPQIKDGAPAVPKNSSQEELEVSPKEDEEPPRSKFLTDALKAHNKYRKMHGVEDLVLDDKLCNVAQGWANHLAQRDSSIAHNNSGYGENIYWMSATEVDGTKPVDCCYAEVKYFNFRQGGFHSSTGHFTQVVLKDTKRFGMAYAHGKRTGATYVVANYDPPGNYMGRFQQNVLPCVG